MILPTLRVQVLRETGHDLHGQPVLQPQPSVMAAPVKLKFTEQHTTVRTDSAGSHGMASETVADVVILVKPTAGVELGDVLTILGYKVRVSAKHPRYEVGGRLDHYQLDCVAWV